MGELLIETDTRTARVFAVGHYDAPPETVWRVFAEKALIERWYGPPEWPAVFDSHELSAGAISRYRLMGPEGEATLGYLMIVSAEAPSRLEFVDGHRDASGTLGAEMLHAVVELSATAAGTTMTATQDFADSGEIEQLMVNQIEGVLSTLA